MISKNRVLIVEDEKDIAELISLHLKRDRMNVEITSDAEDALQKIKDKAYDLLILDWMLPGMSGMDVCKLLRNLSDKEKRLIPVLMVTARAQKEDIVQGLENGADDYLSKPFEIVELVARVRALLRRGQSFETNSSDKLTMGFISVDLSRYEVLCEKKQVELTPSEFKLLVAMMQNSGRVLTRDRLISLVQGDGVSVIDRTVDTHVFGLRKKLGKCGDAIETIRGVGYRVKDLTLSP